MDQNQKFIAEVVMARRTELGAYQDNLPRTNLGRPSRQDVGDAERLGQLPKTARKRAQFAASFGWEPDACDQLERGKLPSEEDVPNFVDWLTPREMREWIQEFRRTLDWYEQRLPPDPSSPSE